MQRRASSLGSPFDKGVVGRPQHGWCRAERPVDVDCVTGAVVCTAAPAAARVAEPVPRSRVGGARVMQLKCRYSRSVGATDRGASALGVQVPLQFVVVGSAGSLRRQQFTLQMLDRHRLVRCWCRRSTSRARAPWRAFAGRRSTHPPRFDRPHAATTRGKRRPASQAVDGSQLPELVRVDHAIAIAMAAYGGVDRAR